MFVTADGDDLFYDARLADLCLEQINDNDFIDGQGLYNDVYGMKSNTVRYIIETYKRNIEPHEITKVLKNTELKVKKLKNINKLYEKKNIRMTLDYEEDFDFFKTIIENLNDDFTLKDILSYINDNKSVIDINYFRENDWKVNQGI